MGIVQDRQSRKKYTDFFSILEYLRLGLKSYLLAVSSTLKKPTIFLKRRPCEIRINAYNAKILELTEANMDIQFVLDAYAAASYVVSYMMKAQRGMSRLMQQACAEARRGNKDVKSVLRHMANKFIRANEISVQEAVYLTIGLKLRDSSRTFVFVPSAAPANRAFLIKQDNVLAGQDDDSTDVAIQSLVDRYARRAQIPEFDNITLADFAAWFEPTRKQATAEEDVDEDQEPNLEEHTTASDQSKRLRKVGYRQRDSPKIIRFVNYKEAKEPNKFFREQLMLFHPWRLADKEALPGTVEAAKLKDEAILQGSETFEMRYKEVTSFLEENRKKYVKDITVDFEEIAREAEKEDHEGIWGESFPIVAPCTQHDDNVARHEMDTSQQGENHDEIPDVYDIAADLGTRVEGHKSKIESVENMVDDLTFRNMVRELNPEQRKYFDHLLYCLKRCPKKQLCNFISGGAGVGKSVLARAIIQAANRWFNKTVGVSQETIKVLVIAPTGTAAFNIGGFTIHSALEVPVTQSLRCYKDLSAEQLARLELLFMDLQLVLHDKISMTERILFDYINMRLQDIKGDRSRPFGGVHYLAFGDLFQIPPCFDKYVFEDLDNEYGPLAQNIWKDHFSLYELRTIMRQRDAALFAERSNRLREGEHTQEDIEAFKTRLLATSNDRSAYSILHRHMFSTHKKINVHNAKATPFKKHTDSGTRSSDCYKCSCCS